MWSRRSFLRFTSAVGASAWTLRTNGIEEVAAASAAVADRTADEVARDETYWREIQEAFAACEAAPNTLMITPSVLEIIAVRR